ncbi:MAG: HAMP domain-containing sensor histidine kinase [Peptoniphilus sp.]|nr:HAMP domain-containing sensor histidine kinase [Peptoniphilus sp.]MDY3118410.1 HAMP domain-containing sensor histidine kinase [Peptoniphilus sp.]
MNKYKQSICIVSFNFLLSLAVVYLSPRLDLLTLFGFFAINFILLGILIKKEKKNEDSLEERIDHLFLLLHAPDGDFANEEVTEGGFGKLRDEIVKIMIENRRIAAHAEKNREILREYTEDIAHQIKTPLTGSLLLLDLLEDEEDTSSKEYRAGLRNNLLRLHNLSDILLKLASLDSETIEMTKDRISAGKLVEELIRDCKDYFIQENIQIPLHGDDFFLICDKKWTYEAVFNVMKNGIEASEDGQIEMYLKETNVYKSIFVEDFSEGLDQAMLEKVFTRFYKADPTSEGYGIGLSVAKSVMERQNGELLYHKGKRANAFELRFYN